ncbi:PPE family protein [Actinokineospora alba]|uniref:PPE family protein n=1 Tax=Actinokineospora alba TaxID=504798 RepID=A0A1H0WG56_9PSEU|nr:PPE domain-containing protein [Actinokineospora alba]TDP65289.1 PPE family protein [Actinokineospora alba]SDH58945.1 PPE family protein [Actinokineospora alba]SDP89531.1 PPE family protein [Actinokineospora alba]
MTEQTKRWRGFTHEELYRLLHEGPGAQASADPGRRWAELASTLSDVGQDLATALDSSGATWVGRAAGRAYERLAPLAAWATAAGESAAEMRTAVENQGDYVAKARADMPVPQDLPQQQPDPTIAPAIQVVGAQTDPEPIEAAQSSGELRAFEVMAAYEEATAVNLTALSAFEQPAELLDSGRDRHSNRGQGIGLSAVVSTIASAVAGALPSVVDKPRGHHSPHVREVAGNQGVVLSGATLEAEPARRAVSPGISSGAAPMEAHPAIGAAPSPGPGSKPRDGRSSARATPAVPAAPTAIGDLAGTPAAAPMAGTGGTGAPVSPTGAAPTTADKPALRRFGTEALGSSQWFAETESTPSRDVSGRRRDLGSVEQVTESVVVDGEDHHLPPNVIGG